MRAIVRALPDYLGYVQVDPALDVAPWSGLRPCTPDGLPYLGRFKRHPNLLVATGHAMLGITLAPVTGRLVADLVAGLRLSIDIRALSPDRFAG